MSLPAAFFAYATQFAALTSALGSGANERVCPEVVPQGAQGPHVVYQRLSSPDIRFLAGPYSQLHRSTLQVKVYARDQDARHTIAAAVRSAMRHWFGAWSDVEIREVNLEMDFDGSEYPADGSESFDRFTLLRYAVWHRNTTET